MKDNKRKGQIIQFADHHKMSGDWADNAQEFADQVKSGEVTHGVMIYRDVNGQVHWRIFNEESSTYALGLIARLSYLINVSGTEEE